MKTGTAADAQAEADALGADLARLVEDAVAVGVAVVDEDVHQAVGVARHQVGRPRLEGDEAAVGADRRAGALAAERLAAGRRHADPAHRAAGPVADVDVDQAVGVAGEQRVARLEGDVLAVVAERRLARAGHAGPRAGHVGESRRPREPGRDRDGADVGRAGAKGPGRRDERQADRTVDDHVGRLRAGAAHRDGGAEGAEPPVAHDLDGRPAADASRARVSGPVITRLCAEAVAAPAVRISSAARTDRMRVIGPAPQRVSADRRRTPTLLCGHNARSQRETRTLAAQLTGRHANERPRAAGSSGVGSSTRAHMKRSRWMTTRTHKRAQPEGCALC